jgi:hypothetical protein
MLTAIYLDPRCLDRRAGTYSRHHQVMRCLGDPYGYRYVGTGGRVGSVTTRAVDSCFKVGIRKPSASPRMPSGFLYAQHGEMAERSK